MTINILSCVLLLIGPVFGQREPIKTGKESLLQIKPGSSATEVRRLLGKPDRIGRQLLFHRHIEQWIYDDPLQVRIEIIYSPGEEGRVQSIYRLQKDTRR